ncbi:hypothetical protein F4804DRAFT_204489 [Jackrogersella minutella]|nr:hypothetical protein F4804DRAFT_204489 [Jackrogersella minutella]
MLAKQQIFYAALFGSVAQAATQFPTCVSSCVRQSGCSPTDTDCMCEKSSDKFLSEAVICMNQWCPSDTKFSDLLGPIQSACDVPQDAISAAEKVSGFATGSSDSDSSSSSASAKPSVVMSVGEPNKIDGPTSSVPAATGSVTKAAATASLVLSDSTAVITQSATASDSLLVAATSTAAAAASSTSSSDSDETTTSSDGSPAGGSTDHSGAATSQASLLAAVLAVGAAISFGW